MSTDTNTPRTALAQAKGAVSTAILCGQLETELQAAQAEVARLKHSRELDFEIFHEMRMKLTAACGDPYKLHDEALDAVIAELTTLRARVAELEADKAMVITQTCNSIRDILRKSSAGEVNTWGFVAMFMEMINEAQRAAIDAAKGQP